jgi:iron complex outermembrane receptor protein
LSGVAATALTLAGQAFADDAGAVATNAPAAASGATATNAPAAASGTTAAAAPTAPTADPSSVQEVVVFAKGQTRQIQTVTVQQMTQAAPGTSPLRVLESLPGVNFEASDPFGAYEWAVRISVRGFNQNQMGFTLDGVPLGDMEYGNVNGLHISRAISSENLGATQLSEGTGALGTASTSNLGGTIEFHSRAPAKTFGVDTEGTIGSYNDNHAFVRVDSGELAGGGAGYISFSDNYTDKWKGYGAQKGWQANSKFVQPLGDTAKFTGFLNYSDRRETDYQDLSLYYLQHYGYKLDNNPHNFALASQIGTLYNSGAPYSAYPAQVRNPVDPVDVSYWQSEGLRKDTLGGGTLDWTITPGLNLHVTGYEHVDHGEGIWGTPYVPTPGGAPLSLRTTEYGIQREGVVSSLDWRVGHHDIEGGLWYEHNHLTEARRYYGVNSTGSNFSSLNYLQNPFYTQWYGNFDTDTAVFHLQDNWTPLPDLKVNFGFKTQTVDITATQSVGTLGYGKLDQSNGFLPQVGVNYNLHQYGEVFADFAENQRAFIGADTTGPFSTTEAGLKAESNLKPETSDTSEVGYRWRQGPFDLSAAAYYVLFNNRLLTIPTGPGILGSPTILANVGSVTTKGVELTGGYRFLEHFRISGSYSYNDSTTDGNVTYQSATGPITEPTAGKTVVDAPKNVVYANLAYDNGGFFANIDVNYMSKRYFTYTNDESVPGHAVADLGVGYRFSGTSFWTKNLEIQANVYNLFNEQYISTIGTNGFTFSGDNQTLQVGSPITAFISVRKHFF